MIYLRRDRGPRLVVIKFFSAISIHQKSLREIFLVRCRKEKEPRKWCILWSSRMSVWWNGREVRIRENQRYRSVNSEYEEYIRSSGSEAAHTLTSILALLSSSDALRKTSYRLAYLETRRIYKWRSYMAPTLSQVFFSRNSRDFGSSVFMILPVVDLINYIYFVVL